MTHKLNTRYIWINYNGARKQDARDLMSSTMDDQRLNEPWNVMWDSFSILICDYLWLNFGFGEKDNIAASVVMKMSFIFCSKLEGIHLLSRIFSIADETQTRAMQTLLENTKLSATRSPTLQWNLCQSESFACVSNDHHCIRIQERDFGIQCKRVVEKFNSNAETI